MSSAKSIEKEIKKTVQRKLNQSLTLVFDTVSFVVIQIDTVHDRLDVIVRCAAVPIWLVL